MQEDEAQLIQRVMGHRLSYLSRHAGVRRSILERMRNEDPLIILTSLDVDGVQIDVLADEKGDFAGKLDALLPEEEGVGNQYSADTPDDNKAMREHLWYEWEPLLKDGGPLHEKLKEAITTLLNYKKRVKVGGTYEGDVPGVVAKDTNNPRLIFSRPSLELPDVEKLAGQVPPVQPPP